MPKRKQRPKREVNVFEIVCPSCKAEVVLEALCVKEEMPEPEGTFDLKKYLDILKDDPRIYIQLIGYYIELRKLQPRNVYQTRAIITRHLKAASALTKAFSPKEIMKAMDECEKEHKDIRWTLETVLKHLTK